MFFFAFFVVGSGLFLTDVQNASAFGECYEGFGDYFRCLGLDGVASAGTVILNPIDAILYAVFVVLGWLLSAAVTLFGWVVNPDFISGETGILNRDGVYQSWKFIRDFFNIFFIFSLLYIAFTTVFQIQKDFKKTILTLVLAALFVNFSFPISRLMVDVSNVPMYFFINQMMTSTGNSHAEATLGTVLKVSNIQGILLFNNPNMQESDITFEKVNDLPDSSERLLMAIIFVFIFGITLLVFAIMLLVRLVALIMLVIFSSVGFVAMIMPGMKKYSDMWWDNMMKYAFFGPAAMLMLMISLRLFSEMAIDTQNIHEIAARNNAGGMAAYITSMVQFSIPIVTLWFAIGLAQKFSIAGAATISGKGEKFAKWVGKNVTKTPALWAGRKLDSKLAEGRVTKYLSPGAWREAFKKRSEEQKHKDKEPIELAGSTMQDQLNAGFSRVANTILPTSWKAGKFMANTDHTDHRFDTRQKQKNAKVKEITEVSDRSDVVIGKMEHAVSGKDMSEAEAALGVLIKNNDLNDMIVAVGHKYGGTNEVSSENAKLVLANILRQSGVTDEEDIAKTLMVLSDQAMASGNYAFGGMSHYNPANHTFSISTPAQQAAQVAGKFNNLEPQKQAQMLHPDALFKRDAAGFTDMNDDIATAIIPNISKATSDQSNRSRSDMRTALQNAWEEVTVHGRAADFPNFVANYNDPANSNFRYYIGKMLEQNSALPAGITAATMPATI